MKKTFLALFFAAVLILSMTLCISAADTNDGDTEQIDDIIILGDVNGDGEVTNADVLAIYRYIYDAELYPLPTLCNHSYGDWTVMDPTTCEADGRLTRVCKKCLAVEEAIVKGGHVYEETVVPPTYYDDGYTLHVCKRCDYSYKDNFTFLNISRGLEFGYNDDGTCYISGIGECTDTDIIIPDNAPEGELVTGIGESAFKNCTNIKSISIPERVRTLGQECFRGCTSLESVIFDEDSKARYIENMAFYGCTSLTEITVPSGVTFIGERAFKNCTALKSIVLGGIMKIDAGAFSDCESLEDVYVLDVESWLTASFYNEAAYPNKLGELHFLDIEGNEIEYLVIPSSVENIGDWALENSTSLTGIVIPSTVKSIGKGAFKNCTSLVHIEIDSGVTEIGNGAFMDCTSLTSVSIPESVTGISNDTFYNCTALESAYISSGVTEIGDKAFYNCTSLTAIELPDTLSSIGSYAFYNCIALSEVSIPAGVTTLKDNTFEGCALLETVNISKNLTSLGNYTFIGCTSLENVIFAENSKLNNFGDYTFSGCTALESITIPEGVTSFGKGTMSGCAALVSINFEGSVDQWLDISKEDDWDENTGDYTVYCPNGEITKDGSVTYYIFASEGLEYTSNGDGTCYVSGIGECTDINIILPEQAPNYDFIVGIGDNAFENCDSIKSVLISQYVTSIGANAFKNCTSLESITIPAGVTSIGDYAFQNCKKLGSIDIPLTVTTIGVCAFNNCSMLNSVNFIGISALSTIKNYAFSYCTSLKSITIPAGVTVIGVSVFDGCSELTSINVDAYNEVYASVDGNLYNKDKTVLVKYAIGKSDSSFTVPMGVTAIGNDAFYECENLESVTIPASVNSIGNYAFYYCTSLKTVTWAEGSEASVIGACAFYSCMSLESIKLPGKVQSIGDYAFYYCTGLESINFGGSTDKWIAIEKRNEWNTGAGDYTVNCTNGKLDNNENVIPEEVVPTSLAFKSNGDGTCYVSGIGTCTDAYIVIPETSPEGEPVTGIGAYAFEGRTTLKGVTLPAGITSIGIGAFGNCTSLESVTVLGDVASLPTFVFYGCTSLKSVVLPKSVKSIGISVFEDCTSLTDVYFMGSEQEWGLISIGSTNEKLTAATIHYNYTIS